MDQERNVQASKTTNKNKKVDIKNKDDGKPGPLEGAADVKG